MTIQVPNPGTGNGTTGDNEFLMWTKVKDNFNNQTHAASRLIGTELGKIPLAEDIFKAASSFEASASYGFDSQVDLNDLKAGSSVYILDINSSRTAGILNKPDYSIFGVKYLNIKTYMLHNGALLQLGISVDESAMFLARTLSYTGAWSQWRALNSNKPTYLATTAAGANVVVDSTGKLMRSTSSERYKDIIADLELDDVSYANAMQLAPIAYRSTADADNPAYHYYSFSAEALGAYDPAFTLWRETETVTDDEGNTTEQPLDERQAEGINLNAIVAFLHATNVKQGKLISALEAKVAALEKEV